MAPPSRTIIFLHVPRTGGTTFQQIPPRNYRYDERLTLDGVRHRSQIEQFAKMPESERAKYKFISGHLYFGFHEFVPGASTYATFLREPISRALSFYCYARNHSDHYLFPEISGESLGLKQLLKRKTTHELFNLQTRMIAGVHPTIALDRHALDKAKENLRERFCFVGLTEEFGASMILLARMLGWRRPFYVKRNATGPKQSGEVLDEETLAMLSEANALDTELYQFGRKRFHEQLRAAGDSFAAEYRRFQRLNFVGAPALEQYENLREKVRLIFGARRSTTSLPRLKQTIGDSTI